MLSRECDREMKWCPEEEKAVLFRKPFIFKALGVLLRRTVHQWCASGQPHYLDVSPIAGDLLPSCLHRKVVRCLHRIRRCRRRNSLFLPIANGTALALINAGRRILVVNVNK